jgi:hypothetical protein
MDKEKLTTFGQGALAGGVVMAIGLFWGGVAVTAGSAESMAYDQTQAALVSQLTPICVDPFSRSDNKVQLLKDLGAKDSWDRGGFVKTNGWATMPGSETPRDDIARDCADMIIKNGA